MPQIVRLPYISFKVANSETVTVQSRVAGIALLDDSEVHGLPHSP